MVLGLQTQELQTWGLEPFLLAHAVAMSDCSAPVPVLGFSCHKPRGRHVPYFTDKKHN